MVISNHGYDAVSNQETDNKEFTGLIPSGYELLTKSEIFCSGNDEMADKARKLNEEILMSLNKHIKPSDANVSLAFVVQQIGFAVPEEDSIQTGTEHTGWKYLLSQSPKADAGGYGFRMPPPP